MLPNRFPDRSDAAPEYNSVDASLWYVIAANELLRHRDSAEVLSAADRRELCDAICEIVSGYAGGTRFGIARDTDGLLLAGDSTSQLTWMDAKVGTHAVTPRSGKAVEVQGLWLNAVHAASAFSPEFQSWLEPARRAFEERFWNKSQGALYDVVDGPGGPGTADASLRPNQIFAAGGLPLTVLGPVRARRVVDIVEAELWTPLGLRTLTPRDPAYVAHYEGNAGARDAAYHQGTVWPWLLGPFVEAWVKSRGATASAKQEARERFLRPLEEHLDRYGLDHVSEVADAEAPHIPRGCPFQAWSLGEFLRLDLDVLRL
jgi:predicted glycogen debranching enzyme